MRAVLHGIGWVLGGVAYLFVTFTLSFRVVNIYGPEYGFAIAGLCAGAAWAGHTERSRRIVEFFFRALERLGISQDAFAIDYGTSKSKVSEARSGVEQLSMSRAANVDPEVWEEFAVLVLKDSPRYVVMERGVIADVVLSNIAAVEAFRESREPAGPQLAFSASSRKVASA